MLKYLLAFVLIMHGLAHVTGALGFWSSGSQAFGDKAWIFSQGITATSPVGRAFGLLWLVALIGFAGTGLGLLFGQDWWPSLAMAAAVTSLVAIVPWVRVVPPGAWGGAFLDLLVVAVLLSPWADRIVKGLS
jgi:Zn-dependent protease with chaperone function